MDIDFNFHLLCKVGAYWRLGTRGGVSNIGWTHEDKRRG